MDTTESGWVHVSDGLDWNAEKRKQKQQIQTLSFQLDEEEEEEEEEDDDGDDDDDDENLNNETGKENVIMFGIVAYDW